MSETSLLSVRSLSIYTYYGGVLLSPKAPRQSVYVCNYERKREGREKMLIP
jgi:hypothetical protein